MKIFTGKRAELLVCLERLPREMPITRIRKKLDITNSTCIYTINEFEKVGITKSYNKGRNRFISITEKGKKVCENIKKIKEIFGE